MNHPSWNTDLAINEAVRQTLTSAHPILTPAALVASGIPTSPSEDIRDIRRPRHIPTPLAWVAVAAGVLLVSAAAFATRRKLRRGKLLCNGRARRLPYSAASYACR
jgi:hypothetical protein